MRTPTRERDAGSRLTAPTTAPPPAADRVTMAGLPRTPPTPPLPSARPARVARPATR